MPNHFVKEIADAAWARSKMYCEYCGEDLLPPGKPHFHDMRNMDHITPRCLTQDHSLENAAAACVSCHGYKSRSERARGYVVPYGATREETIRNIYERHIKPYKHEDVDEYNRLWGLYRQ
jgi:5-methylcytosine-specific restriction endonuclease McrA